MAEPSLEREAPRKNARFAQFAALAAAAALLASGPGTRLGAWPWQAGLALYALAGILGLVAAIAALRRRRFAVLGLGLAAAAMPAYGLLQALSAPRANDARNELLVPGTPEQVFPRALAAAESMQWAIVKADARAGSIDAVATTFWFGFRDDVRVRVAAAGSGSRVEVQSRSRVGKGDAGTNARRIDSYFERLR